MPKFRIHMFEEVRRTYEVEAESIEDAAAMVDDNDFEYNDYIDSERTGNFTQAFLVDPILENDEVDYENVKWFGGE